LTPCRAVDERGATGPLGGPAFAANSDRVFILAGACGIPPDALAIAVNATVTQSTAAGQRIMYRPGARLPDASTISYARGQTRANNSV
jgi:hypothetical protein